MIPKDPMILLSCWIRWIPSTTTTTKRPISLFEITIFNNLIPLVKAVKTAWQAVFFCYRNFLLRIT